MSGVKVTARHPQPGHRRADRPFDLGQLGGHRPAPLAPVKLNQRPRADGQASRVLNKEAAEEYGAGGIAGEHGETRPGPDRDRRQIEVACTASPAVIGAYLSIVASGAAGDGTLGEDGWNVQQGQHSRDRRGGVRRAVPMPRLSRARSPR